MAKTKIIVVKLKKLLMIAVPAVLLFLFLLFLCLHQTDSSSAPTPTPTPAINENACYRAGVYTSLIELQNTSMTLEVTVDTDRVRSIRLLHSDETAEVMYPLFPSAAEHLGSQLASGIALDDLEIAEESRYTETLLIRELREVLKDAKAQP